MNPHKVKVKVKDIQASGEGVYSVRFEIEKKYTRFKAGQFLHLTLDEFDPTEGYWPESRVFSICTVPKSDEIGIVYSVKGQYTKRMEEELAEGKDVWIKLPYGEFIIQSLVEPGNRIVMVAGGTGISPFVPFLVNEASQAHYTKIDIFYGVRSRKVRLFGKELEEALLNVGNLDIHSFYEDEHEGKEAGRLSIDRVWKDDYKEGNTDFFLSGPPAMIAYFKNSLSERGIEKTNIHIDDWE